MSAWLLLVLASAIEIVFAVSMKASEGLTRVGPTALLFITAIGGPILLTLALKEMPVSIAYPIWTGLGATGAVLFGVFFFGESLSAAQIACIVAIAIGVMGLNIMA